MKYVLFIFSASREFLGLSGVLKKGLRQSCRSRKNHYKQKFKAEDVSEKRMDFEMELPAWVGQR